VLTGRVTEKEHARHEPPVDVDRRDPRDVAAAFLAGLN